MFEELLLEDGSWLLVAVASDPATSQREGDAPKDSDALLGGVGEFVALAAVGGAIGNFTYDMLRAMASEVLGASAPVRVADPATSDEVVDSLRRSCVRMGYGPITIHEIVGDATLGWTVHGDASGEPLLARADPTGVVVHVRIG